MAGLVDTIKQGVNHDRSLIGVVGARFAKMIAFSTIAIARTSSQKPLLESDLKNQEKPPVTHKGYLYRDCGDPDVLVVQRDF